MRLPLSKVYRAFAELDRFTDAECELFVRQAARGSWTRRLGGLALRGGVALGVLAFWVLIAGIGARFVDLAAMPDIWKFAVFLSAPIGAVAVPMLVDLFVRDVRLRRAILKRLRTACCPGCDYSLLGLPIVDGQVRCPECGQMFDLAKHELTADDILGKGAATPGAATPSSPAPPPAGPSPPGSSSSRP